MDKNNAGKFFLLKLLLLKTIKRSVAKSLHKSVHTLPGARTDLFRSSLRAAEIQVDGISAQSLGGQRCRAKIPRIIRSKLNDERVVVGMDAGAA